MRIPRRRLSLQGRRGSGDGWRLWHINACSIVVGKRKGISVEDRRRWKDNIKIYPHIVTFGGGGWIEISGCEPLSSIQNRENFSTSWRSVSFWIRRLLPEVSCVLVTNVCVTSFGDNAGGITWRQSCVICSGTWLVQVIADCGHGTAHLWNRYMKMNCRA
jgi:hypothetical protein